MQRRDTPFDVRLFIYLLRVAPKFIQLCIPILRSEHYKQLISLQVEATTTTTKKKLKNLFYGFIPLKSGTKIENQATKRKIKTALEETFITTRVSTLCSFYYSLTK